MVGQAFVPVRQNSPKPSKGGPNGALPSFELVPYFTFRPLFFMQLRGGEGGGTPLSHR